jgi:tRNA uridine 5-carboxymethylaminomethyl modification enzyme
VQKKISQIHDLKTFVYKNNMIPEVFNKSFAGETSPIDRPTPIVNLVRRPEIALSDLLATSDINTLEPEVVQEVEFGIKYEGYIKRNQDLINRFHQYEKKLIPKSFDYRQIEALSSEAIEKLDKIKPDSFGQASRISGVSPADLSVLLIHLERYRYQKDVSRETIS